MIDRNDAPRVLELGSHVGGRVVAGVVIDRDDQPGSQPGEQSSVAAEQLRRIPRRQAGQSRPRLSTKRERDGAQRTKPQTPLAGPWRPPESADFLEVKSCCRHQAKVTT